MKKLLSLVLVLTFVFGGTAIAAEKFNLSGQYRMEMYNIVDDDHNSAATSKDDKAYIDQRFRLQFDFMPADGVKAILRGDFAESNWGSVNTAAYTAPTSNASGIGYRATALDSSTIMIDKAYVDLQTAMINWKVGLWGHAGFGKGLTTDNQGANVMITGDFAPVAVTALYTKVDEGTALTDDVTTATRADEDQDIYGLQVAFKSEAFGVGGFYAVNDDKNNGTQDDTQNVLGIFGDASFGMVSLWAELDMYGGDNGLGMDYVGQCVTVQAAANLTEQLKLTVTGVWSAGSDDTATETTIYDLTEDSATLPFDFLHNNAVGEFGEFGEGAGEVFNQFEGNTGAKTLGVKANFAVSDALALVGGFAWSQPDVEDPNNDGVYYDSATIFAIGGSYTFLPGTTFHAGYENTGISGTTGLADDSTTKYMGMLTVNF